MDNNIVTRDWLEIVRVMTLVEGDTFEEDLGEDCAIKIVPAEPTPMTIFRFPGVCYALEPSSQLVIEITNDDNGATKTRCFLWDGSQRFDFELPLGGDPAWN